MRQEQARQAAAAPLPATATAPAAVGSGDMAGMAMEMARLQEQLQDLEKVKQRKDSLQAMVGMQKATIAKHEKEIERLTQQQGGASRAGASASTSASAAAGASAAANTE